MNARTDAAMAGKPGMRESLFAQGNAALRDRNYSIAMECYLAAPFDDPVLGPMIGLNAVLARRGWRRQQQALGVGRRVAVCAHDLSDASSSRAAELARLYQSFADVEMIGSVFAKRGEAPLFPALVQASVPIAALKIADRAKFIELAVPFVLAHPCDAVHLCGPTASNILLGLLFRVTWDARVLVDIDSDALADATSLSLDEYTAKGRKLPGLEALDGENWAVLAAGMAASFDWLSVRTDALRKRFGGFLISGEEKFRAASTSRLRKQTALQALRPGATSPKALRLLHLLPEARVLHSFGILLDLQAARLAKAPPPNATRARVVAPQQKIDLADAPHARAGAVSQLARIEVGRHPEPRWIRISDLRPTAEEGSLLLFAGTPLGLIERQTAQLELAGLSSLCALEGLDPGRVLSVKAARLAGQQLDSDWPAGAGANTGNLHGASFRLADLWYASDSAMRLRFEDRDAQNSLGERSVLRCYQIDGAAGSLQLVAELVVDLEARMFADVALPNPLAPLLFTATNLTGKLEGAMLLPFPSLCRGGWHHGELAAIGARPEYMANLMAMSNVLLAEYLDPRARGPLLVARLRVDLQGATGAEKIFSSAVRRWLGGTFGLRRPAFTGEAAHDDPRARFHLESAWPDEETGPDTVQGRRTSERESGGGWTLQLPADSLPTISALVSRRPHPGEAKSLVGPFVLADPVTGRPRTVVNLPPLGGWLLDLQPRDWPVAFPVLFAGDATQRAAAAIDGCASVPLAISYRGASVDHAAALLSPIAPDAASPLLRRTLTQDERQAMSVSVLLAMNAVTGSVRRFVESLSRQTIAHAVEVVAALGPGMRAHREELEGILVSQFPGRHTLIEAADGSAAALLNAAASRARGKRLLVADPATLLHDTRALETLCVIAMDDSVATAGCLMLREEAFKKGTAVRFQTGGFYPSHVSLLGAPHLVFTEPYTLAAFPAGTYPVVGNSFRLALVNASAWNALGGLDVSDYGHFRHDLDFCVRAHLAGYANVCTTAVSASCLSPGIREQYADSHSLRNVPSDLWQALLSRVTLLHEIGA